MYMKIENHKKCTLSSSYSCLYVRTSGSWSHRTTYVIRVYHPLSCEFVSSSRRNVFGTILCDKVCQWLATGQWFSLGTPVSSIHKTDRHDIIEILLKVALITMAIVPYLCVRVIVCVKIDVFLCKGCGEPIHSALCHWQTASYNGALYQVHLAKASDWWHSTSVLIDIYCTGRR
jgi:hypothetical protein